MPIWVTIVISLISCIGTGGILVFVQFLIQRHDNNKGLLKKIADKQNKLEKDELRTQLLLMMSDYPQEHQEILLLAERYFYDLRGNWFCSTLFNKYLQEEGLPYPDWFTKEKR